MNQNLQQQTQSLPQIKNNENSQIKIGDVTLKSCVMLAPMAGITDLPYRQLIRRFSSNSLLTTEMISSEMLMQNRKDGNKIGNCS